MPRHRTISCQRCGFMLLKRDYLCEQCGSITRRAKMDILAKVAQFVVIALAGLYMYFKITGLAPH